MHVSSSLSDIDESDDHDMDCTDVLQCVISINVLYVSASAKLRAHSSPDSCSTKNTKPPGPALVHL